MLIEEVSRNPLTDRVISSIRDLILQGEVMPGDYLLSQPELASRLGVGLSTVREAIRALSMVGLLEPMPGRGTMVLPDALKILSSDAALKANLDTVDLNEILETRLVLEIALTRMAAERSTPEDVAVIEAHLEDMQAAGHDREAFARADLRFHLAVAQASKNRLLAHTYYLIQSLLEKSIEEADALPGGTERALVNHRGILDGIRNREPGQAQQASEQQVMDILESLARRSITLPE